MRKSKLFAGLFAVLGVFLAAAAVLLCLTQRDAAPRLLGKASGATKCVETMFGLAGRGDYAGASACLYGHPQLGSEGMMENEASQQIWEAFVSSLRYEMVGDCYATVSGVAQNVRVRSLNVAGVLDSLKTQSQTILEARIESAESMDQVYDGAHEYRADFVASVLRDAAAMAIADGSQLEWDLTVNLVYDHDQWLIVPDQALLNALAGGILE